MALTALAVTCATSFTACGGDDDDKPIGNETEKLTVGTHRVDVDFSGDTSGWSVNVGFVGSGYPDPTTASKLYEDGKQLELTSGSVWMSEGFRSYSVSTDDRSQCLTAMVMLTKREHVMPKAVTVTLKGYVNGKMKKTKSFVADGNHTSKTINFNSEAEDADQEIDLDY